MIRWLEILTSCPAANDNFLYGGCRAFHDLPDTLYHQPKAPHRHGKQIWTTVVHKLIIPTSVSNSELILWIQWGNFVCWQQSAISCRSDRYQVQYLNAAALKLYKPPRNSLHVCMLHSSGLLWSHTVPDLLSVRRRFLRVTSSSEDSSRQTIWKKL